MATGGYEFEVVENSIKEYECPICLLLIRDASMLPCSHTLCQTCLRKWEEEKSRMNGSCICPTCKAVYKRKKIQKVPFVDRIITTSLKVKCKESNEGCDWIGSISDYEDHTNKNCLFALLPCPFSFCDVAVARSSMENHQLECSYRNIICEYCDVQLQIVFLEVHKSKCKKYPITCPNEGCEIFGLRGEIEAHRDSECEHEIVSCDFHTVGCSATMKRTDKEQHLQSSLAMHLGLVLKSNNELSTKLTTTTEKLEKTTEKLNDSRHRLKIAEDELQAMKPQLEIRGRDYIERLQSRVEVTDHEIYLCKKSCESLYMLVLGENYFKTSIEENAINLFEGRHFEINEIFTEDVINSCIPYREDRMRKAALESRRKYLLDSRIPQIFPPTFKERYKRLTSLMTHCELYQVSDDHMYLLFNKQQNKAFFQSKRIRSAVFVEVNISFVNELNGSGRVKVTENPNSYDLVIDLPLHWTLENTHCHLLSDDMQFFKLEKLRGDSYSFRSCELGKEYLFYFAKSNNKSNSRADLRLV